MLFRKRLKRTLSVITCVIPILLLLLLLYFLKYEFWNDGRDYNKQWITAKKRTILQKMDNKLNIKSEIYQFRDFHNDIINTADEVTQKNTEYSAKCFNLKNCFNYNRCVNGFYVYVYSIKEKEILSPMYIKILEAIKSSIYFTTDPKVACIFVLSLDTLDRDPLSKQHLKGLQRKIENLEYWNNGENHVIFNFFSGTWPNYLETLSLNIGKAIIAKASFSMTNMRSGYDLSLPLLPGSYAEDDKNFNIEDEREKLHLFPIQRKYLVSFKGKRYLHGIGSETRNSLYLLNNDKDILLLTTCRHGKGWEKMQDERCQEDNDKYDRYDYNDLLQNSTFCLVPRGRRLGSFRFLEVLKYGCIPVLLSNDWHLPFKEVLDWSKFSINIDERLLLQLPTLIREIPDQVILAMKQQALFVWKTYFSSVKVTIKTLLEVLRERISPSIKRPYVIWNKPPGALNIDADFSSSIPRLPFYGTAINSRPYNSFTAVILAVTPVTRTSDPLFKLINSINLSNYVDQILVVWLVSTGIPNPSKWPKTRVSLQVVNPPKRTMNSRYINMDLIKTDAVFSFDEDICVNTAEIDFAFSVWRSNPDRLIGFETSSHYLDSSFRHDDDNGGEGGRWRFTSKKMNEYSMVRTSSAIYHRYYNHHYSSRAPKEVHRLIDQEKTCESLAMNFMISHLNGKAPIKTARSPSFAGGSVIKERLGVSFTQKQHFEIEQKCFDRLREIFGGIPLVRSKVAMNPLLFRDPVSVVRKKFRKLG